MEERVEALKALAGEYNIRTAPKLQQQSLLEGVRVTLKEAQEALRVDLPRQVLAPKPRSLGKSAAEGPNERLQFDLIDFSNNTTRQGNPDRFALVGIDVYTREMAAAPLETKTTEEVNEKFRRLSRQMVGDKKDYVVTTDKGREFSQLQQAMPREAAHREKTPADTNATGVLDANMKTLKIDLAGRVAKHGTDWNQELGQVVNAYNKRPQSAVHGPPANVEGKNGGDNPQNFRVLQNNADKFMHNRTLTQRRMAAVRDAGGFRAPTGATRSFQLQYGDVREAADVDSLYVTARDGRKTLLKHAQPAPDGSRNAIRALVTPGRNFEL